MSARAPSSAEVRGTAPLVLGAGIALISITLRAPVTAVGPVLDDIRDTLGLSATAAGLLTMLPLLCFGLAAPLAPRIVRGRTPEGVLLAALAGIGAGVLLRLPPAVFALFAGTFVLGSAVAIANVIVPTVIKRDFPRPGTMMGVYAVAIGVAGALGAGLSVPLERLFDGSWRVALASWVVVCAVAIAGWLPIARTAHAGRAANPDTTRVTLWRDRQSWMISCYFGCQALLFYSIAAWLPDILKAHGATKGGAGGLLSLALFLGVPSSLAMPILAERVRDQRVLAAAAAGTWLVGLLGLLVAPEAATVLWVVCIGVAQGAGVALALALFALRARDGRHAAALSAMAQSVGYLVAAFGPLAVGALHDVSGGWTAPTALMVAAAAAMLAFGLAGAAPGWVEGRVIGAVSPGS